MRLKRNARFWDRPVLSHVVAATVSRKSVDRPLLIHTCSALRNHNNASFLDSLQTLPHAAMSVNRCVYLLSRFQRHVNSRTTSFACSCRLTSGSSFLHKQHQLSSVVCCRDVSNNSSTPKPPDTSLFVPVSLRTDAPADGTVGAELTQPLDKSEKSHVTVLSVFCGDLLCFVISLLNKICYLCQLLLC